jgi:small subunit ribosomal protein S8e
MGITRMGDLKHTKSGARSLAWRSKRNHAAGRPAARTRIGATRIHPIRTRGGNLKHRALRLDKGTFAWASENTTRKVGIIRVVWHPSDNEFVRTNTLTKGSIVEVEASEFKKWYERQYGRAVGRSDYARPAAVPDRVSARWKKLEDEPPLPASFVSQFDQGRVLAAIASRPGQCGRADGYLLEGDELDFYRSRLVKKTKQTKK